MRQPEAFLDPQNAPKPLAAGALPQTPLGSLQCSPRPPSWIQGVLLLRLLLLGEERGGERRRAEGRGGRGGERRAGEGRVCLVLKLPLAMPLDMTVALTVSFKLISF